MPDPSGGPVPPPRVALCRGCGRPLSDSSPSWSCPDCHTPLRTIGIRDGMLIDDRPCLQCGYSLKGLPVDGRCPECGGQIARSLHGNLLVYSSPSYLTRLVLGSTLILWGLFLYCASLAIFICRPNRSSGLGEAIVAIGALVNVVVPIVSTYCGLAGWWLLSSPDPALLGLDRATSARKVLRVTLLISTAALTIATCIQVITQQESIWSLLLALRRRSFMDALTFVGGFATLANVLAWPVKTIASLQYTRSLAFRVPSKPLADRSRSLVRFATLGAIVLVLLVGLFTLLDAMGARTSGFAPLALMFMCGGAFGILTWSCVYATLIGSLRGALVFVLRRALLPPDLLE